MPDTNDSKRAKALGVSTAVYSNWMSGKTQGLPADLISTLISNWPEFDANYFFRDGWPAELGIESKKPRPEGQNGAKGLGKDELVDPVRMPPEETAKMLAGYFDFGDRVIKASLLLEAYGPPGRFGGYSPDEPGTDE